jgi:hypothetical protein
VALALMRVTPHPVNFADFYKQYSRGMKSSQALKFKLMIGKNQGCRIKEKVQGINAKVQIQ